MPIYAYRCTRCGHAQDVLQKMSDPVLTVCPACGASSYAKQVTAAGFQLKGSGWPRRQQARGRRCQAGRDRGQGGRRRRPGLPRSIHQRRQAGGRPCTRRFGAFAQPQFELDLKPLRSSHNPFRRAPGTPLHP